VSSDPKVDFEQDIGSMDPAEAHDAWEEMTNLDAPALRELKDSKRNKVYLDKAEGNQGSDDPPIEGGPLEDAIRIHKDEIANMRWGWDPAPDDSFP